MRIKTCKLEYYKNNWTSLHEYVKHDNLDSTYCYEAQLLGSIMIQVVLYHLCGGMRMFKFYGRGTMTSSQEVLEAGAALGAGT